MRKPALHKSFGNAFHGIFQMMRSERNFQIHILGLLINIFLVVYLELNPTHAAIIFLAVFLVMVSEVLNTAAEKICDFIHPEFDRRIGFIKDISAGAVVLSVMAAIMVGVLIYSQYIPIFR